MFTKAKPIWLKDKSKEKNVHARFTTNFVGEEDAVLKITGATFYKVILNGKLIHYGPAPTAGGYARIDELKLITLVGQRNTLTLEVAGYNCFSYAAVKQPSYVCAEVTKGGKTLASTGFDFDGYLVASREQKVLRYSFQRHFTEVWHLDTEDVKCQTEVVATDVKYLERKAPLPDMFVENMAGVYSKGEFTKKESNMEIPSLQGAVDNIGDIIDGFTLEEIKARPIVELYEACLEIKENPASLPCTLAKGNFAAFKCSKNTCGLINLKYEAEADTRIIIAFDEKLVDGKFDYENWDSFNVVEVNSVGEVDFTNFEVYGFQYFAVFVVKGSIKLKEANVVKIRNPISNPPKLNTDDVEILKIYEAACESARCNSLGNFTDCPSRERAGWLCDSYYTAQAAYALEGNTLVEDDFLENFALAKCPWLPEGMLPMCYPADHPNGNHIPQWAMWYVLELNQYKERNKNISVDTYKAPVYNLLGYFEKFENELGLLEDLPGWNFVEWSRANDWTLGINFPTNMLYSYICKVVGEWFEDSSLTEKSAKIKSKVLKMSYDGKFFRDQAIRNKENIPVVCEHISEVCQYYAFMFDIVDTNTHPELYNTLTDEFTPQSNIYPHVERANALMGLYMRMELLFSWGKHQKLIQEIKMFFGHMSDITGTLWEHKVMTNSLNHGFTAYLCVLLLKIYNR